MQFRIIIFGFAAGIITGMIFDFYRIIRGIKTVKYLIIIEDTLFWILCSLVVFVFLLYTQYAVLSVYVYIYLILGIIFYLWMFSKYFIAVEIAIIKNTSILMRILIKYIVYPFKFIFYKNNKVSKN
ncbi:spore cortex biosynthesis protein YabQ [Clostridium polynesiense]|uniref:spore cortex biosynthesis protein YabQ n=1 Tax=Clostridium polynesiense TaxID=1325933 RepID=UPI001FA7F124|nr:spore cortex biosynthesis protein YabQ [Clostridium polynesiense]